LLLAKDVAVMLACSTKHVHNLVDAGRLNPVRLSPRGHLRFRPEDIERIISGENGSP
jgi:predicted site-specific integrase-resolvase